MKKRFIPSVSGANMLKLFDAETGQLYRMINTGNGKITGQPIVSESEVYVEVTEPSGRYIKYYGLPHGGLIRSVQIN